MGLLTGLWTGLCAFFRLLLGQWSAPPWLRWCASQVGRAVRAGRERVQARPGASVFWLLVVLALALAGHQGARWWQSRPQPVEVGVTVTSPALTDYAGQGEPAPLVLEFSASAAPLSDIDKAVTGITLMPAVDGEWRWQGDRRLVFKPKVDWPVGATYQGVLAHALVAPQVNLKSRDFVVKTAPFEMNLAAARFYQDPASPQVKRAVMDVAFSHPVNTLEFEKRIGLRMAQSGGVLGLGRGTTPFTVTYDKAKLWASIHSANLPIPKEATQVNLEIGKGVRAQAGGAGTPAPLTGAVNVPGLYGLTIEQVGSSVVTNEQFEPEQVLTVRTSQSVHERELAKHVMAWVLPLHKPGPTSGQPDTEPYAWPHLEEITAKVLGESTRLELAPIPAEHEHSQAHAFKLKADVGRVVYVQVEPQLKSFGGYVLAKRSPHLLRMAPYPAELRLLSEGALLPLSGDKKVAVLARDLPGLKVEIGRVRPDQLQHLVSQAQGSYANPVFLDRFDADNITDRFERTLTLPQAPGKAHYETIELGDYLAKETKDGEPRRGLFLLKVQGFDARAAEAAAQATAQEAAAREADGEPALQDEQNERNEEEAHERFADAGDPARHEERRLVLVTDLGIVMKHSVDGGRDVFVQSLFTGLPVPGASVDIVARNGSNLFSAQTDAAGHVRFDKLDGLTRERAPLMVVVRKAGDMSFLPLNRAERNLDVSRFDVGGLRNERTADQLSAYLFSDRGIYRPGETLRLGLIVKAADWRKPLEGVPLEAEVLDARGLAVKRERIRLEAGGFTELSHTLLESAPTGNYTVNVNIVKNGEVERQIGSTTVKVQEFLPDRMKVTAQLSAQAADGWVHPKDLKARIGAQNLFGTPAANRRVEVSMALSPAWPAFRSFPDYAFFDPLRAPEGFTEDLPEGRTDDDGQAAFELNLGRFAKATYRLSLLGKVFEPEGGRSVSAETNALVSELPYLVGVKHDGELGFVSLGSQRASQLIAIDPQAKRRAVDGLILQLLERKTVSVLMRQPNDTYRYESRRKDTLVSETPLGIPLAGQALPLDTRKAGNFSYVVRDAAGLELNRIDFSVAGQGNVSRSLERNAELQLTLNKADYLPGEEIEVGIRAPYVGAGLITIERDKVYTQAWFKTTTTASVQKIKLPADFEGNGYVSVHFVRDPGSDEIFMSPLSHGVVPFATNLGTRTNPLKLEVPELTRPGQALKVRLSASRPTRAVVFAVDEGILQVARYKNAEPLGFFFQKRALEVRTSQILDLLLPEFKRLMAASAPGGDDAGANARFLNPFKRKGEAPAVYWSGIVDVKGDREFSYTVPDHFNGSLRVMAVAVDDATVGVAQAKALVRGDFVLSPNVPAMVSPGDVFEVSVGVANNIPDAAADAPVLVTLRVPPTLEVQGGANQTLKLGPMREGVVLYRLKAKEAQNATLGSATLRFSASLGAKSSLRRLDVSVRPATPKATTVSVGQFKGATEVPVRRELVPEFRKQELAMSTLPLALAPALMNYLDNFPHACTEQLVSRALPGLVMARRPEFGLTTPQAAAKGFDEALRVLRSRQNAEGGFGQWAAGVNADEFASVYATHLLLEAAEFEVAGAGAPADMLKSSQAYLERLAASPPADLAAARTRAYAIYLLTRQGQVTTPLLTSLREALDARFAATWQLDATAAFVAATYQQLKQDKPALTLVNGLIAQFDKGEAVPYAWADYQDPVVRDAQLLYLVARHFPTRLKGLRPEGMARFMAPLGQGQVNTLSAAYTVLALDAMARAAGAQSPGKLSAEHVNAQGEAAPLALPANLLPRAEVPPGTARLNLRNDAAMTTYYALTQTGFDRSPPPQDLKAGMEVLREYLGADGKPVTSVKVGDEVVVRLNLRGLGATPAAAVVNNVALTDLLPGGFEPVQNRDPQGADGTVSGPALEFADVREDRVVVYSRATANAQTYTYRIRATHVGEFTVPPAYAESLYDRARQARSLAGRLTVVAGKR
jgi:uncharacterized protein YfaS (alpha-2-macroglobulin family)